MKLARVALLTLAACFAACERVEVSTNNTSGTVGSAQTMVTGHPPGTLIDRIAGAREQTRFQGERRVELYFEDGGVQKHSSVRERVSADGNGAYSIETLEVLEPQLPPEKRDVFLALQSVRQGMNWRYRDFAIHSVPLFLQNYRTVDTGTTEDVAGRHCLVLQVARFDQSGGVYTLAVDDATGLVLRSREETLEGAPISEIVYESLALDPDLSGVAWHQAVNNETPLPLTGDLVGLLGFEARSPRSLPAGYQLLERAKLQHPQDLSPWVKETFGDGVESLFFLHGGPIVAGNGISSGAPPIQADLVELTSAAPWLVARGNLKSERVIALGKVREDELLLVLRSAME